MRLEEAKNYHSSEIHKGRPHPPPNQPLPMYQMANPVTEWGAPGAYTRRKKLIPYYIPEGLRGNREGTRTVTTSSGET